MNINDTHTGVRDRAQARAEELQPLRHRESEDYRDGYVDGAEWQASQPATDAEVQAFRDAALKENLLIGSSVARRILTAVGEAQR